MDISTHRVIIHAMYYKIASENHAAYKKRDEDIREATTRDVPEEELSGNQAHIDLCYQERERAAVVAITFSGMALEAFFYDYAAAALTDSYVKSHLDKLDLKSKYLVYPKLVCGKQPDKGGTIYASLKRLVSLRNDLVHFKSEAFEINELHKASAFHDELADRLKVGVTESLECVIGVMRELDRLHEGATYFEQRMKWDTKA